MTDFVVDIKGNRKVAKEYALKAKETIMAETEYVINDGVMRWLSNNRVVPTEWYEFAAYLGYPVDVEKCDNASRNELSAFIDTYINARRNRSYEEIEEEQASIRAAHGEGAKVINILTGEVILT